MKRLFQIIPLLILFQACDATDECERKIRNNYLNEQFSGVVKDCYFQSSNGGRGIPTIVLGNNEIYHSQTYSLVCYVKPWDSIVKTSGSLKYLVYRDDSVVTFYPQCGRTEILDEGTRDIADVPDRDCAESK